MPAQAIERRHPAHRHPSAGLLQGAGHRRIRPSARLPRDPLQPLRLPAKPPAPAMKEMLNDWNKRFPGRLDTIFGALKNVAPSHLADPNVFDFANLENLRHGKLDEADSGEGLDILAM